MERSKFKLIEIPFAFFGMGVFRVWTETVYSNGLISFPAQTGPLLGFEGFNLVAAVTLFALALLSKRVPTFYDKPWVAYVTCALLVVSACLNFASIYFPAHAAALGIPAVVFGGVGISLIIVLWSEFFSCLNPLRVGLYFSGGLIAGALLLWLFKGLAIPWLWVCTCLVPPLSLFCLKRAYQHLDGKERPHVINAKHTFPWKPIGIVVLYSFAYGLCGKVFNGPLSIHSGLGCVVAALLIYLVICQRKDGFSFSLAYKVACPVMIASLIPFSVVLGPVGGEVSAFLALAGYTLITISIMVIMSNLCYQHGFNAIWLFAIERAVRLLSVQAGIEVSGFIDTGLSESMLGYLVVCVVVAVPVALATRMFLSESSIMSPWGTALGSVESLDASSNERAHVGERCSEIARDRGLTPREEEVFVLLALGKKPAQIEQELYVASSTVKTHVKHIYQKLEIHSRKELMCLVGIDPDRE